MVWQKIVTGQIGRKVSIAVCWSVLFESWLKGQRFVGQ